MMVQFMSSPEITNTKQKRQGGCHDKLQNHFSFIFITNVAFRKCRRAR
jgi:hypothetical protein